MLEVEQCLDVCKGPDGVVGVTCVGRRVVEVSRPECGMRVGDRLVWLNGMKVVDDSGIVSELLCAMPRQFEAVVLRSMFAEGEAPLQQPGTEAPAANHPAFHTSTYAETCRRLADQGQRRQLYPSELATLDAVVAYRRLHSCNDDTALLFGVSTDELLEHERRRVAEESAAAAAAAAVAAAAQNNAASPESAGNAAAAHHTKRDPCTAKTLRRRHHGNDGVSAAAAAPSAAGAGARGRGARPAPGGLSYMEPLLGTHALLRLPESREGHTRQGGGQRAGRLRAAARCCGGSGGAEGRTGPEGAAFPPLGVVRMTPQAAQAAAYEWQHTPLFNPEEHLTHLLQLQ